MTEVTETTVIGCILGTAVGDALGLPWEGLSKKRQQKRVKDIQRHHFIFDRGMISDDTEHTCIVAQSLIVSGGDEKLFSNALAWRLKFWLLGLPAGIGSATLKAIIKLWIGFNADRSGVYSAGNGAAMRTAIIGVCYGYDIDKLRSLVRISTRITHTDPKAEYGALAVAIAAYLAASKKIISPQAYYDKLEQSLEVGAEEFLQLIRKACDSAIKEEKAEIFATNIGNIDLLSALEGTEIP